MSTVPALPHRLLRCLSPVVDPAPVGQLTLDAERMSALRLRRWLWLVRPHGGIYVWRGLDTGGTNGPHTVLDHPAVGRCRRSLQAPDQLSDSAADLRVLVLGVRCTPILLDVPLPILEVLPQTRAQHHDVLDCEGNVDRLIRAVDHGTSVPQRPGVQGVGNGDQAIACAGLPA